MCRGSEAWRCGSPKRQLLNWVAFRRGSIRQVTNIHTYILSPGAHYNYLINLDLLLDVESI